ncbi:cupin domain-containing protein [Microbacterium sp. NPDC058345]|uniref:cupin domain-containing protein n=1 Tax=Microbacterium sp. NPDC058345 TaxID=3346455 RepID=UPI0036626D08
MTGIARAGAVTDAAGIPLAHEPLPASERRKGAPRAGAFELGVFGGVEIGVWEMTPGVAADVESDEVFVVLSGRARVDFASPELPSIDIGPGAVVRLASGMRTVWTVTETLRKVYLAC